MRVGHSLNRAGEKRRGGPLKTHQKSQPCTLRQRNSIQQVFILQSLKFSARKLFLIAILSTQTSHSLFLQKVLLVLFLAISAAVFPGVSCFFQVNEWTRPAPLLFPPHLYIVQIHIFSSLSLSCSFTESAPKVKPYPMHIRNFRRAKLPAFRNLVSFSSPPPLLPPALSSMQLDTPSSSKEETCQSTSSLQRGLD